MEIRRKKGLNKSKIVGHNKVVGWIIIVLTVILILLLIFIKTSPRDNGLNVSNMSYCALDSDCVPDSCCHASSCVNTANKPVCKSIMCTQECVSETMDCGQGSCKCINEKCKAVLG